MKQIVLMRHGESTWNKANLFTGWTDVDLSEKGFAEAKEAGRRLKAAGFEFDECHTSMLKRAIRTLWIALDEMDKMYLPIYHNWRLNERHYGALQGLNKAETAEKYGEDQVTLWRRSFDVPPPPLEETDDRYPGKDPRYQDLEHKDIPKCESLKDTITRALPFWNEVIVPKVQAGTRILISAHGNSLRAIVKHLDNISDKDIVSLNIPTGMPLVYEFEDDMTKIRSYYLASDEEVAAAQKAVIAQGKVKPQ